MLAAIWTILDQGSKAGIAYLLPHGSSVAVAPLFNIVHVYNPGAAFSFLADQSGWQRWFFGVIALVASMILVVLLYRRPRPIEATGFALILAGAIGNVIDRGLRGAVLDWLDFYWGELHWPAFNLADIGIMVGAALIIAASFRPARMSPLT